VNVKIIPPGATFPDKIGLKSSLQPVSEPEKETTEVATAKEDDKGAEE